MNHIEAYFADKPVDLSKLSGTWCIQKTSLDFWRNRFSPQITYTLEKDASGQSRLLDEVQYLTKKGKSKAVIGYDRLTSGVQGQFLWQAKPWYLRFLKSEWGVVAHDEAYADWAVTYFSKTAFTKAGMDIYSRSSVMTEAQYNSILDKVADIAFLQPFISQLYQTKHLAD